jgi:hypothetical protein
MQPINDDERILELDRLETQAKNNLTRTHPIVFASTNHNLPVFKIDLRFPRFRMENGRTKRKQLEFRYKNPDRANELDDPSSKSAQAIQQAILQDMAAEADLIDLLKQGQHEPLLLRHDGYVVNGNRRLAAMRLIQDNPQKYQASVDFGYVDVARLPVLEEKEIRRIEQRLQMSQDGKADYNWVDELLTIEANIEDFGMSMAELAKDMHKQQRTIENELRMLKLIEIYLERIDKPGMYFEVEGDEQAFMTLAKQHRAFEGDVSKQTRLLDLSFPIIRHNERGESKHLRIGKIAADLPNIETKIASVLSAQNLGEDLPRKSDILDSVPGFEKPQALQIGLDSEASSLVHEAIRQVDRERDLQDEANGPAESVAQAATLLRNVRLSGSMTKVKQIRGQLKAIRNVCDELLEQVERIENSALDLDK